MSGRSGSELDQVVKGAAPLDTPEPPLTSRSPTPAFALNSSDPRSPLHPSHHSSQDPLATLPSSPPQIYLNLLILEASLRSQYLLLRARRRQNTFFLLLLALWNAYFFYALFLHPREDGSGIGGSVYWVVETGEKVALMGGVVTGILIWGTGQWERGVRWPRRFIGVTNRGLRTMNCKIIVIKRPWWREMFSHLSILFPFYGLTGSSFHYVDAPSEKKSHFFRPGHEDEPIVIWEEDLTPGGDCIKLLLLPKPFSADFRENWELYRTEYWERENERRAMLLRRLQEQEKQIARSEGGWLFWIFGIYRKKARPQRRDTDLEKMSVKAVPEKDLKKNALRQDPHSRTNSRSSTPGSLDEERPPSRGSGRRMGSFSEGKRRPKISALAGDPRPNRSSLSKGSSSLSTLSTSDSA
ncbi:MAG: hypothetical protein LQ340_000119 [Diploschistes diacapsis]|nr:MAG: hypothetical protein LQ340_000119 [Diploschistes diacapsis]